jgi:hypothetical protein
MSDEHDLFSDGTLDFSWNQYAISVVALCKADHDPENTLQVALTRRELTACSFGMILLTRMFPELGGIVHALIEKLGELGEAQEFFPGLGPEEDE